MNENINIPVDVDIPINPDNSVIDPDNSVIDPDNQVPEKPKIPVGLCLLHHNNIVMLNNVFFVVQNFTKKSMILALQDKSVKLKDIFKIGDIFDIKNGIFRVNSFGTECMTLNATPGSHILDSKVIEDMRKANIRKSQKALKV